MTEWSVLDSDETVQTCSEAKQRTRQRARRNVLSLSPSDVSATTASKITMATNTNDVIRKRQRIVDGVRVVQLMLHRLWRKMACAVLFCALRLFAEAQRVQAGHLPLLAASVEWRQLPQSWLSLRCRRRSRSANSFNRRCCSRRLQRARPQRLTSMHLWWRRSRRCPPAASKRDETDTAPRVRQRSAMHRRSTRGVDSSDR